MGVVLSTLGNFTTKKHELSVLSTFQYVALDCFQRSKVDRNLDS